MKIPCLFSDYQSIALFDCRLESDRLFANLGYFRAHLIDRPYALKDKYGKVICTIKLPEQVCRSQKDITAQIKNIPLLRITEN